MEREDLLEKGFRLAHFLFRERTTAIYVLTSAFDKLNAQHGYESKRTYWRDKYLKRRIYRISREQADVLQWLIYFESEHYERQQERLGLQTEEDLVVRYVKFLVQTTTARSSFYVCVGLQRLLCRYTTAEAQKCYEFVADRYLGSDEYRRAKSVLIERIQTRFGDFLRLTKAGNGELTFESSDSGRWRELVRECLIAFTPWSTANNCLIPQGFNPQSHRLPHLLSGLGHKKQDQDEIEINRCNCFINPVCHRRLTHALGLDAPEERLALPNFSRSTTDKSEHELRAGPPDLKLTQEERSTIENKLDGEARRRHRVSATTVRILVDGNDVVGRDIGLGSEAAFEITEGARLIELITSDDGRELVLATQMVPLRHRLAGTPVTSIIPLRNSTLTFTFLPMAEGETRARVSLRFLPSKHGFILAINQITRHAQLAAGLKYAVVTSLCICMGWIASAVRHHSQLALLESQVADLSGKLSHEKVVREQLQATWNQTPSFQLVSDELRSRSAEGTEVPVVKINNGQSLVKLIIPVEVPARYHTALKPLLKDRTIFSEDIPQTQISADHAIVLYVPTSLFENTEDYSVVLSLLKEDRTASEMDSFTFRLVKQND